MSEKDGTKNAFHGTIPEEILTSEYLLGFNASNVLLVVAEGRKQAFGGKVSTLGPEDPF